MAVQESRETRTFIAGEALTSHQFKFVTLESDGQVDAADSAGENCIGVLLNDPASGGEATVVVSGKTVVEAGGSITAGGAIATAADGQAAAATTGNIVMGYALEDGAAGQRIAVELIQGGNAAA
jgi:hypothetical protein